MRWEMLCGKSGYLDTPQALLPVYWLSEREIVLVDSGVRPDPKLLEELERRCLRVRAVLCTHLHPDHVANNAALIERHGAEIFAHVGDLPFLRNVLRQTYPVTVIGDSGCVAVDGVEFGVLPTPGHSAGHLAFVTPDDVCCVGDALMAGSLLRQSKMPYMEDVDRSIASMENLRETQYPYYIVAHKGVVKWKDMPALVDENIRKELDIYDLLRQQLTTPKSEDEVLRDLLDAAGIQQQSIEAMPFIRVTAKTRLDALIHAGEYCLDDGVVVRARA